MAIILIAVVLAVITGLNYFGKPISRTMWLVLFILSSVALVLELLAYLPFWRFERLPRALPKDLSIGSCSPPPSEAQMRALPPANARGEPSCPGVLGVNA